MVRAHVILAGPCPVYAYACAVRMQYIIIPMAWDEDLDRGAYKGVELEPRPQEALMMACGGGAVTQVRS